MSGNTVPKVFHVDITDDIRLILDINPYEMLVRVQGGELVKALAIAAASVAPRSAEAGNNPCVFFQPSCQTGMFVIFQGKTADRHGKGPVSVGTLL